jgi:hypothetical protein
VFHQEDEESLTLQSVAKEGLSPVGNILKKNDHSQKECCQPDNSPTANRLHNNFHMPVRTTNFGLQISTNTLADNKMAYTISIICHI